ncbi:MAG TPA: M50 family metallopeptidase [Acidimicrobiia bacterium]|nr:M50 family metallopeptidase [Acidimicrobiia bacterium]
MAFSGDHFEPKSPWSKARSYALLSLIVFTFIVSVADPTSRGYALVGFAILMTIMLHEAGHFIAAKWAKMKATEFFVGFGPRIWSFRKGETEYGIKAIPLGGYVKIIGMTDLEDVHEDDEHRTYRKGQTRKKLVVIMAGVTVNVLLAYLLLFTVLVAHGEPVAAENSRAVLGTVNPGSAGSNAGLKPGDVIIKIDGTPISTFDELGSAISKNKVGDKISVSFLRDGKTITKTTTLQSSVKSDGKPSGKAQLGVGLRTDFKRVGVFPAIKQSGVATYNVSKLSIIGMGRLFSPSGISDYSETVVTGDYENQNRPQSLLGIGNIGGQLVNQDIWTIFYLMAFINIFLALINALPLLPLDGGHAAIAIYERIASKIKKREVHVDYKKLMPATGLFLGFLALLMLSSLWLDVLQITS